MNALTKAIGAQIANLGALVAVVNGLDEDPRIETQISLAVESIFNLYQDANEVIIEASLKSFDISIQDEPESDLAIHSYNVNELDQAFTDEESEEEEED